jgi:hypothetical protein
MPNNSHNTHKTENICDLALLISKLPEGNNQLNQKYQTLYIDSLNEATGEVTKVTILL